ncbi:YbaB/EbfC family nucleoid-associated protein [Amycolatopsis sp. NBC_00345]|uniref:YbaB/EbfC family nucleoid-associated protein n=1 Tax=Amycolatopsis sp. NBC_00345 TaxID=2975955 RepID=UPI002E25E128
MSAEMDRLVAEFDKFQSKVKAAETKFAQVGGMQEELAALEAQAVSADRSITVVAGPSGSVKGIRLTADAMRQQPQQLADAILATLHQAVAEATRQQAGIVDAHVGAAFNLDVSEQVFEAQAEALGTTAAELKSQLPEEEPARPARDEEEDFDQASVLRKEDDPSAGPRPSGGSSAGDQFLRNLFDEEDHR